MSALSFPRELQAVVRDALAHGHTPEQVRAVVEGVLSRRRTSWTRCGPSTHAG